MREWLKLRYALIPYFLREAEQAVSSGLPIFRSLVFHHEEDPVAWTIEDEFYCGGTFLVAPIISATGARSVYLPAGEWIDFWTGERSGARLPFAAWSSPFHGCRSLSVGAVIPYYPEPVPARMRWTSRDAPSSSLTSITKVSVRPRSARTSSCKRGAPRRPRYCPSVTGNSSFWFSGLEHVEPGDVNRARVDEAGGLPALE